MRIFYSSTINRLRDVSREVTKLISVSIPLLLIMVPVFLPAGSLTWAEETEVNNFMFKISNLETDEDSGDIVSSQTKVIFNKDFVIGKDEELKEKIIVIGGNVLVEGSVIGSIGSFRGNIHLLEGSMVTGNLVSINGKIEIDDGAILRGKSIELSGEALDISDISNLGNIIDLNMNIDSDDDSVSINIRKEDEATDQSDDDEEYEENELSLETSDVFNLIGNVHIPSFERVRGDVVSVFGNISIMGKVNGDVFSFTGNIKIGKDAEIHGDVITIFGNIKGNIGAIGGDVEAVFSNEIIEYDYDDNEIPLIIINNSEYSIFSTSPYNLIPNGISYDKVDGLGIGFSQIYQSDSSDISFVTALKYRSLIEKGNWAYNLGFGKSLFGNHNVYLFFNLYNDTDCNILDKNKINDTENSLAAVLFRSDYRNYFEREGSSVSFLLNAGGLLGVDPNDFYINMSYHYDEYSNLDTKTGWAFFKYNPHFGVNPPVVNEDETGKLGSFVFTVNLDTRNDRKTPDRGWENTFMAETTGGFLSGDYNFEKYDLILTRYDKLDRDNIFSWRLWASWSNDNLPLFRQYSLGGPGTLRGYDFDSISSPSMNKMLLMNVEWSTKLDDDFILGAFIDAGSIYPVGTPMNLDDISTDAGLSIMPDSEGSLRVDIAKPLSDKDAPIKVSFRLSRTI